MCGHYGICFSDKTTLTPKQREDLCGILANRNDTRGGDSWGYFSLDDTAKTDFKKGVGALRNSDVTTIAKNPIFFAHSRAATQGSVKVANAHPFEIGDITGSHNGCIGNTLALEKKYNRDFEVDSMHVFAHLNEGLDLGELTGWGTIIWHDKKQPKKIFFSQIGQGQLSAYTVYDPITGEPNAIVWSSDGTHIIQAFNYIKTTDYMEHPIQKGEVYSVDFDNRTELVTTNLKIELGSKMGSNCSHKGLLYRMCNTVYDEVFCEDCESIIGALECDHG